MKRIDGPDKKTGKDKMDLAEQLMADIDHFRAREQLRADFDEKVRVDRNV